MFRLSIIIPVYYNENNLYVTYNKIKSVVLDKVDDYEIIFVDDGSQDNSYSVMENLRKQDGKVKLIKLSRNFGQHQAILAGLSHITGDCAAVISADLQDPPYLITEMLEQWQMGNKVVIAIREEREDSLTQKLFAKIYYKVMQKYALKDIPIGGFDCFLADKSVIEILVQIDEKNTSLFAQLLWLGFKRAEVFYSRQIREVGVSRWTLSKKIKVFLDAFLGFSYLPIRLISIIGILDCIFSLMFIIYLVIHRYMVGGVLTGWSSLMVAIMFTSGVQMLTLGVIGEYLWRNFDATRKRPTYIIDEKIGFELL